MGPGFAVLPAPSYGRTTEFLKCLFMQQAGYFCSLHPTMGQLRCYETCSQPPRTLGANAKHIAGICRLTLLSPACSQPSCLSIHSKSTQDRAQYEPLSPVLPGTLFSKEPGCGRELPWAGRAAGLWRAVQPTPLNYLQHPQTGTGNQK